MLARTALGLVYAVTVAITLTHAAPISVLNDGKDGISLQHATAEAIADAASKRSSAISYSGSTERHHGIVNDKRGERDMSNSDFKYFWRCHNAAENCKQDYSEEESTGSVNEINDVTQKRDTSRDAAKVPHLEPPVYDPLCPDPRKRCDHHQKRDIKEGNLLKRLVYGIPRKEFNAEFRPGPKKSYSKSKPKDGSKRGVAEEVSLVKIYPWHDEPRKNHKREIEVENDDKDQLLEKKALISAKKIYPWSGQEKVHKREESEKSTATHLLEAQSQSNNDKCLAKDCKIIHKSKDSNKDLYETSAYRLFPWTHQPKKNTAPKHHSRSTAEGVATQDVTLIARDDDGLLG